MLRTLFLVSSLLSLSLPLQAQTEEVPGMPADPTASQPPDVQPAKPPAEGESGDEAGPRPPVLPEPMQSGEEIEPEVRIIERDGATIEEYRLNGNLYMVKITPSAGKPYYLVDRDGDGNMESRMSGIYDDFSVPQWVLFSW